MDWIPEKKRKLVLSLVAMAAVHVSLFLGHIEAANYVTLMEWIVGGFIAGNGVEHISNGGGLLGSLLGGVAKVVQKKSPAKK